MVLVVAVPAVALMVGVWRRRVVGVLVGMLGGGVLLGSALVRVGVGAVRALVRGLAQLGLLRGRLGASVVVGVVLGPRQAAGLQVIVMRAP